MIDAYGMVLTTHSCHLHVGDIFCAKYVPGKFYVRYPGSYRVEYCTYIDYLQPVDYVQVPSTWYSRTVE